MDALALAMPVELLQQICKNLLQPDLKNCRLVCKHIRFTAEKFLFRHILLRRNPESFRRLRLIADHPEIRNHVRSLCYDPRLFSSPFHEDFETWYSAVLGHGHFTHSTVMNYAPKLGRKELEAHYQRYCAFYHSDQLTQKYDVKTQDLMSGLAKLSHLGEVWFLFREVGDDSEFHQLSSISQETLILPDSVRGWLHGKQFTALMEATYAAQIPLKSINAVGVPWSVFQQSKMISSMMASATEACQYLVIKLDPDDNPENGSTGLANMVSSSSSLRTLDISLGYLTELRSPAVNLSEIIDPKLHWPYLKRLSLRCFTATDISLKNLLTCHNATLRSLDLAYIKLEPYPLDGKEYHGSWIEIIAFLEKSLSLESVSLDGFLSNENGEMWSIHNYDAIERPCLKERIEQFIVEGGTCPLPMPHAPERPADWENFTDSSFFDFHRLFSGLW
ncbi:hypothetical protein BDR22DRAFT_854438 [Usnea florida]